MIENSSLKGSSVVRKISLAFVGIAVVLGLLFFAFELLLASRTLRPGNTDCQSSAGEEVDAARVVLLGDSWTSQGRLLPGFIDGFSAASATPVTVCSISYPGRTTTEIVRGVREDFSGNAGDAIGGKPHIVLIVAGVNDVIGHTGAQAYGKAVQELANLPADFAFVIEIPFIDEENWEAESFAGYAKHRYLLLKNDFGEDTALSKYRRYARDSGVPVISFTDFAPSLAQTPLRADGIHLTPPGERDFGRYLGKVSAVKIAAMAPPAGG